VRQRPGTDVREEKTMKHIVGIIGTVLAASVLVSLAQGAPGAPRAAWTETKAERMLTRDAEVALPASEKARVADEVRKSASLFRGLELWALEEGDESAWVTYHEYANRFDYLLLAIEVGLRIEAAECVGSGRVLQGGLYRQFHCLATTEVLRIPSVALESSSDAALPTVVEGEERSVGPLFTQFSVRVTGKSGFAYE
jgi:hypothetical protein